MIVFPLMLMLHDNSVGEVALKLMEHNYLAGYVEEAKSKL